MTGGGAGDGDGGADRVGRRQHLAMLAAGGAAGSLAGCGSLVRDIFGGGGQQPLVSITELRLVQTVDNSRVNGASGSPTSLPDPPLVEGYEVAPVVDLDVRDPSQLPQQVTLEFDVPGRSTMSFDLFDLEVEAISKGSDPQALFHLKHLGATAANKPVVFTLSGSDAKVTARVKESGGSTWDTSVVERGTDYTTASPRALRVGFIAVEDPDGGSNYGGKNTGHPVRFTDTVAAGVEYLDRVYPGGLVAYAHSARRIVGSRTSENDDYRAARSTLQKAGTGGYTSKKNFPAGGRLWNRSHLSDQAAESAVTTNGFDATVLVVPAGYYGFHGDPARAGLWPASRKQSASAMGGFEADKYPIIGWNVAEFGPTVAQEVGHAMQADPYDDPSKHPLAQRDDDGSSTTVGGQPVDRDHARALNSDHDEDGTVDAPGLTSWGYDLSGGTFRAVDGYSYSGTSLSVDPPPGGLAGNASMARLESYMSYSEDETWADARIHADLVASGFNRSNWGSASTPVLLGAGRVDEAGGVVLESLSTDRGAPYLPDLEGDDSQVTVTLEGPDGEVLERARVPDTLEMQLHSGVTRNLVEFLVPFPARTVQVRTLRDGVHQTAVPVTRVVRDAVRRVPDRGFVSDPGATREELLAALGGAAERVRAGAFGAALEIFEGELRPLVAEGVRASYEGAGATQPFRAGLLDLLDRMAARLEELAADAASETTTRSREAVPVGLSAAGITELEYASPDHRTGSRSLTVDVDGGTVQLDLGTHTLLYGTGPEAGQPYHPALGVLATPAAVVDAEPRNTTATAALVDVLAGEAGRQLLGATGVVGEAVEWASGPDRRGELEAVPALGTEAVVATVEGVLAWGDGEVLVGVQGGRFLRDVEGGRDAVLAVVVQDLSGVDSHSEALAFGREWLASTLGTLSVDPPLGD